MTNIPLHIHTGALSSSGDIPHILLDAFLESLQICLLVVFIMTLIEVFNVVTKGRAFKGLERHRFGQVAAASGLGMLPGCFGGYREQHFASVS